MERNPAVPPPGPAPADVTELTSAHRRATAAEVATWSFLLLGSFRSYGDYKLFDRKTPNSLWEEYCREHWNEEKALKRPILGEAYTIDGRVQKTKDTHKWEWNRPWIPRGGGLLGLSEGQYALVGHPRRVTVAGRPLPWPDADRLHAWEFARVLAPDVIVRYGKVPQFGWHGDKKTDLAKYLLGTLDAAYAASSGEAFFAEVKEAYDKLERDRTALDAHDEFEYVVRMPELRQAALELFREVYYFGVAHGYAPLGLAEPADVEPFITGANSPEDLFVALQMITVPAERRRDDQRLHPAELASAARVAKLVQPSTEAQTDIPAPQRTKAYDAPVQGGVATSADEAPPVQGKGKGPATTVVQRAAAP